MNDGEAFQFATEISDYLKQIGYMKIDGVNQAIYSRPVSGQNIGRDSTGVKIVIGTRISQ